jgi:hypothetical protein
MHEQENISLEVQAQEAAAKILQEGGGGKIGFLSWLGWGLAALIAVGGILDPLSGGRSDFAAWAFLEVLTVYAAMTLGNSRIVAQRSRAALLLPELDRTQLTVLVALLEHRLPGVRHVARLRLTSILPTITQQDFDALSDEQRTLLFDQLTPWLCHREQDFARILLSVIARVGEEDGLAVVDAVSRYRACSPRIARVRARALSLLPVLERRIATLRSEPGHRAAMHLELDEGEAGISSADASHERENTKHLRLPFLIAAYGIILPFCVACVGMALYYRYFLWAPVAAAFAVAVAVLPKYTLMPKHRRLAKDLEEIDDIREIGKVVDALALPDPSIIVSLRPTLIRLLSKIKASDTALLDLDQRTLLYGILKMEQARTHADLQVAILRALEQIGDAGALPAVQALASAKAQTARQRRVQEEAQNCLSALMENAGQADQSWRLLRPSQAPSEAAEMLVRPAASTSTLPELLLRPTEGEASSV